MIFIICLLKQNALDVENVGKIDYYPNVIVDGEKM